MEEKTLIEKNMSSEEIESTRAEQIVFGWGDVEKAAADIYCSLHRSLLEGTPLFLYKNTNSKSDLGQVVVVRNIDYENKRFTDYGMGIITSGYTMLYPHVGKEYLSTELVSDLEKWKVDKKIIETFKDILKLN